MAEEAAPPEAAAPGFWNVAKQVEEFKKTVEGLAAIAEAVQWSWAGSARG